MGKKSSSSPDVVGAAEKEGEMSRETARDKTYADRPDQYNPFGSSTWEQELAYDPATTPMPYNAANAPVRPNFGSGAIGKMVGKAWDRNNAMGGGGDPMEGRVTKWTQRQTLNPETQELFDAQMSRNQNLAATAEGMGSRISDEFGAPLDWDQFGDVEGFDPQANRQSAEDAAYGRATQRLDPRFESQRATLETQMANRGLRPGDQAYDSAMRTFNTGRNDAYEMAQMGAVGEGRSETDLNLRTNERANALRSQQIEEYLGKRGRSLEESNMLQSSQNLGEMVSTFGGGE